MQPQYPQARPNGIDEILEHSTRLFKQTGLDDLAHKWDAILKNYRQAKAKTYYN